MKSLLSFALIAVAVAAAAVVVSATPLDDYVNKPDPTFKWEFTGRSFDGLDYKGYHYNVTSQTWMSPSYSDRSVWWHDVVVIVPNELDPNFIDKSFMYITGGDNRHPSYPGPSDEDIFVTAAIAVQAKTVCATLFQVPNQPITYTNDPWHRGGRSEDAAIALTWWAFMKNPSEPFQILELPMTKAAVKTMDALQQIIPKYNGGVAVNQFAVGGASKRGWTTWLTAAVDKRVAVAIPIVLDAVHVKDFLHRQWRHYGAWSFALTDYWHCNVTRMVDTPQFDQLMHIVDMWYYRDRLTMPKLVVNAVGDEFQLLDDQRNFIHDMPGVTETIMIKNAEHSLATGVIEVLESVTAFTQGYLNKATLPRVQWNISKDGRITVETSVPPTHVDVAWADSALGISKGRRDFRWAAINATPCIVKVFGACVRPILWTTTKKYITKETPTRYSALVPLPPDGQWRGFIIEMRFKNAYGVDEYYFTSPASTIPDVEPFPDCHGEGCYGHLV